MTTHKMQVFSEYDDGVEIWQCPQCGHMVRLTWRPSLSFETLYQGDQVPHEGFRVGDDDIEIAISLGVEW